MCVLKTVSQALLIASQGEHDISNPVSRCIRFSSASSAAWADN